MKRLALVATITSLCFPALASAAYFDWGYNNVGPVHNTFVASGYNEWDNTFLHKTNGGTIAHGFQQPDNWFCSDAISGVDSHFHTRTELGCGPYQRAFAQYVSGDKSYLFFDASS
jgi:hypothetical protein